MENWTWNAAVDVIRSELLLFGWHIASHCSGADQLESTVRKADGQESNVSVTSSLSAPIISGTCVSWMSSLPDEAAVTSWFLSNSFIVWMQSVSMKLRMLRVCHDTTLSWWRRRRCLYIVWNHQHNNVITAVSPTAISTVTMAFIQHLGAS